MRMRKTSLRERQCIDNMTSGSICQVGLWLNTEQVLLETDHCTRLLRAAPGLTSSHLIWECFEQHQNHTIIVWDSGLETYSRQSKKFQLNVPAVDWP